MTDPFKTVQITPCGPEQDVVTQALIQALQAKGASHVLQWLDGWYERVAMADLRDYYELTGPKPMPVDWAARLAEEVLRDAQSTGQSTSVAANQYRRARLASMAKLTTRGGEIGRALRQLAKDSAAPDAAADKP